LKIINCKQNDRPKLDYFWKICRKRGWKSNIIK